MQPMSHDPAAAAIGAQLVANGAQGMAAGAAANASLTVPVPAGAEEVSIQAATAFAAAGAETVAEIAAAQQELTRTGAAVARISGTFSALDSGAADTVA